MQTIHAILEDLSQVMQWHACAPGAHVVIDVARNYARDEGRPLGAGLQEQASNHLKLQC